MVQLVVAFDPGDVHTGYAEAKVSIRGIEVIRSQTLGRDESIQKLEWMNPGAPGTMLDFVIIERYQLYPWAARQQGFSEFETPQLIGVLRYLARKSAVPVVLQTASVKKKGRQMAFDAGVRPMAFRSLGSGKGAYKGPDFGELRDGSTQHERDAIAHVYHWALTSKDSEYKRGVAQ